MNDPKDKLIVIAHWAILKMGYSVVDEAGPTVNVFMFNQDRAVSSEINYVKNDSAIVTDHFFTSKLYKIDFTVEGQNSLFKTEIDKYLNDDGSLINEDQLAIEVERKLKNILRARRQTRKCKLKRQQHEEKRQKTTTASGIDRTGSDDDDDDEPLDLTTK
ncbi:unnamed protein product [Rotaria sp. Silwood1]|nr:unnamed protein product [Rotaria sp. Silwood1]